MEAVGAEYLPQLNNVGKISGSPTLMVTISRFGELMDTQVSRSSGSAILELASMDIIKHSSPFDEFTEVMASEFDTVAFEYKFLFTEQIVTGAAD